MPETVSFDLVALGTGTAGSTIAGTGRKAAWSVAIADTRAIGGTCALRGCEPKKVLWTVAGTADRVRRFAPVGLKGGDAVAIDWAALQHF
jgi:glutathione reductase (NADPH)